METDSLGQELIRMLHSIRTSIDAGYNDRGCYLSGRQCKLLVNQIDLIMLDLYKRFNLSSTEE